MAYANFLDSLGTNAEIVASRGRFFQLYAARAAELDQALVTAASEAGSGGYQQATAYPFWRGQAARAEALARAGQYSLLVSLQEGSRLLSSAGQAYVRLGVPFGYVLLASSRANDSDTWPPPLTSADTALQALVGAMSRPARSESTAESAAEALRYPTQQTYLLLAIALADGNRTRIDGVLGDGLVNSGIAIGPTGNRVGDYWRFITRLLVRNSSPADSMRELFLLAEPYAQSIRAARQNRYSWNRLHAPVDIVDLDLVMLAVLMARMEGVDGAAILEFANQHGRDPIESIPIAIGCDLAAAAGAAEQ